MARLKIYPTCRETFEQGNPTYTYGIASNILGFIGQWNIFFYYWLLYYLRSNLIVLADSGIDLEKVMRRSDYSVSHSILYCAGEQDLLWALAAWILSSETPWHAWAHPSHQLSNRYNDEDASETWSYGFNISTC